MNSRRVILLLALSFTASANEADAWLHPPAPTAYRDAKVRSDISPRAFFEVPVSNFAEAEKRLSETPIVPFDATLLNSFSDGHFSCAFPESGYLVRALYENAGRYTATWLDSTLSISHESLGVGSKHRSALLICLRNAPTEVFVSAYSDL